MGLITHLHILIESYHEVVLLERNLNNQRLFLMREFKNIYLQQEKTDICSVPSFYQSLNVNNNVYEFEFDQHNQLINVSKK